MAATDLAKLDAQLAPFLALVGTLAPADAALVQLRSSIDTLRPFLDGSTPTPDPIEAEAARDAVANALKDFFDRWKGELTRALLGGLPELPAVRDVLSTADWLSPDGINAQALLGPLTLRVGLGSVVIAADD